MLYNMNVEHKDIDKFIPYGKCFVDMLIKI